MSKNIRSVQAILAELDSVLANNETELRRNVIAWGAELMHSWEENAPKDDPTAGLDPDAADEAAYKIGTTLQVHPNHHLPRFPTPDTLEEWLLEQLINILYAPATWHELAMTGGRWFYYETAKNEYLREGN